MAQKNDPTPLGQRLVRLMRMASKKTDGVGLAAISHRLPIRHAANLPPKIYTVDLAPHDNGTFLVTCRELPEVATFGENEEEALAMAEIAIEEALSARRASPDFPY